MLKLKQYWSSLAQFESSLRQDCDVSKADQFLELLAKLQGDRDEQPSTKPSSAEVTTLDMV